MYVKSLYKGKVFKGENKISVQHFPNYGTIEFELALNDINHLVLLLLLTRWRSYNNGYKISN